jgi:hypothetical protein
MLSQFVLIYTKTSEMQRFRSTSNVRGRHESDSVKMVGNLSELSVQSAIVAELDAYYVFSSSSLEQFVHG